MSRVFVFIALFSALTAPGWCADATLQDAQGAVTVRARGETEFEPASAGDPLLFGDEVQTAAKSSAHVVFGNGDAILLKENARLALSGSAKKTLLSIDVGEFLIGLKRKLLPGESFRVKTPAAVAAVRGTLFWGLADEKKDTTYASFGRSIAISAKGKSVVLKSGQTVKIAYGRPPGLPAPSQVASTYINTFSSPDGSLEGLETLLDLPKKP